LSDFNETSISSADFFEKYFKLMKIHQVGAELFHVGGLTDMTKLIVAIRNFENVPKNYSYASSPFVYTAKLGCGYLCTFTATNFGNSGFRVTVYINTSPVIRLLLVPPELTCKNFAFPPKR
jgi:hypothetical protein